MGGGIRKIAGTQRNFGNSVKHFSIKIVQRLEPLQKGGQEPDARGKGNIGLTDPSPPFNCYEIKIDIIITVLAVLTDQP